MLSRQERLAARIRRASTTGVLGLAVGGFALSYGALHQLATAHGVQPSLAWAWPLIVDGFIVVASLAVLHAALQGRSTAYPWTLVLGFSALSVAFNVVHAAASTVARLIAAVPPLALVLAFELLMRQVRAALAAAPVTTTEERPPSPPRIVPQAVRPVGPSRRPARVAGGGEPTRARAARLVAGYRARGQPVTGAALAVELGVSAGYGRRLLRQLDAVPAEAMEVVAS